MISAKYPTAANSPVTQLDVKPFSFFLKWTPKQGKLVADYRGLTITVFTVFPKDHSRHSHPFTWSVSVPDTDQQAFSTRFGRTGHVAGISRTFNGARVAALEEVDAILDSDNARKGVVA